MTSETDDSAHGIDGHADRRQQSGGHAYDASNLIELPPSDGHRRYASLDPADMRIGLFTIFHATSQERCDPPGRGTVWRYATRLDATAAFQAWRQMGFYSEPIGWSLRTIGTNLPPPKEPALTGGGTNAAPALEAGSQKRVPSHLGAKDTMTTPIKLSDTMQPASSNHVVQKKDDDGVTYIPF